MIRKNVIPGKRAEPAKDYGNLARAQDAEIHQHLDKSWKIHVGGPKILKMQGCFESFRTDVGAAGFLGFMF